MLRFCLLLAGTAWLLCAGLILGAVALGEVLHAGELAFFSGRDQGYGWYLMDVDRGLVHIFSESGMGSDAPLWSPDGTLLSFVSMTAGDERGGVPRANAITIQDADGRRIREVIAPSIQSSSLVWSPDGIWLAFTMDAEVGPNSSVYVMDVATGRIHPLAQSLAPDYAPSWSPDSTRVALVSERAGNADIYVASVDGENVRNLTHSPDMDTAPAWSPDGRLVAFLSRRAGGARQLRLVDVASGALRLTGAIPSQFAWSPDGGAIAFSAMDGDTYEIYLLDVASGRVRDVSQNPASDIGLAWSPDGRLAFASMRTGNWDIFLLDVASGTLRNLTQSPDAEYAPVWLP